MNSDTPYLFLILILILDQNEKTCYNHFWRFESYSEKNTTIFSLGWIKLNSCKKSYKFNVWNHRPFYFIQNKQRYLKTNDKHMIYLLESKSCLHLSQSRWLYKWHVNETSALISIRYFINLLIDLNLLTTNTFLIYMLLFYFIFLISNINYIYINSKFIFRINVTLSWNQLKYNFYTIIDI